MQKRNVPDKARKISTKKLFRTVIVLALVLYVSVTLINQKLKLSRYETAAEDYEQKIAEAKVEGQRLEDELEKAGSEEYLESIAREKLGLVKSNERVFIDITQE